MHSSRWRNLGYPYHALDNGAFPAWVKNGEWKPEPFLEALQKFEDRGPTLDFVVVPDKVAAGRASLDFSLEWLPELVTKARKFLAVQDGMSAEDVGEVLDSFHGIFVGGTLQWKYDMAPEWVRLAHKHRIPCHVGRIGTWDKIMWASRIGADSIDSTSWARSESYHHIEYARSQSVLTMKEAEGEGGREREMTEGA